MELAARDSRPLGCKGNAQGEDKRNSAVGTTYRWNAATALPHTAQRFSPSRFFLFEFSVRCLPAPALVSNRLIRSVIYSLREAHGNRMESVIVKNPKILGGTPVFRGTRVPLQLLFDSLERGHTLEEFLAGYPTVSREMAVAALQEAQQLLSAKS